MTADSIKDERDRDNMLRSMTDSFGGFRAEWMTPEEIFRTFSQPRFFPELETVRACVLEGGRGTGKTTILKSLTYSACLARARASEASAPPNYLGVYFKIDTGIMRSFEGADVAPDLWRRVFQHYWNLLCCHHMLATLAELEQSHGQPFHVPPSTLSLAASSLGFKQLISWRELWDRVQDAFVSLEMFANNAAGSPPPASLSALGRPITLLADGIRGALDSPDLPVFLLVDEYEALLPYQQRVVNTLI